MPDEILQIEKYGVRLSRLQAQDIELVRQWRNHPAVNQFMEYQGQITVAQQKKWFASLNPQVDFYFIIEWKDSPIGLIHTKEIDWEKKSGEAGIFIWEEKSIGTPIPVFAVLAMMDYNFEILQLEVLYAKMLQGNQRVIFYNEMLGYEKIPEEIVNGFQWYALRAERYWRCTERLRRIED